MLNLLLNADIYFYGVHRGLIGWLIIGLLAGWIAGQISRGRGFGCLANVILGLIGAVLGGWIFTKLGIWGSGGAQGSPEATRGFLYSLAAATVGAVVLVAIARLFSSSGHE